MTWPATAVGTGELISAAQLSQLPIGIARAQGAAASYTFSSIPQAWSHLMIVTALQSAAGAQLDDLWVTFNGDTGARYIQQFLRAIDTTVSGDGVQGVTKLLGGTVPGASSGAYGTNILFVADYSSARYPSLISLGGGAFGNALGTNVRVGVTSGSWIPASPTAITSVTLTPAAGAFVDGSVATLYGLGSL